MLNYNKGESDCFAHDETHSHIEHTPLTTNIHWQHINIKSKAVDNRRVRLHPTFVARVHAPFSLHDSRPLPATLYLHNTSVV